MLNIISTHNYQIKTFYCLHST